MAAPSSRRRDRKKIVRSRDGVLYDAAAERQISVSELREYLSEGGLFEARRQDSGADCTLEVLQDVVAPKTPGAGPGMAGDLGALGGLGGLGAAPGGLGPLAALGQLARFFADPEDRPAVRHRSHRGSGGVPRRDSQTEGRKTSPEPWWEQGRGQS